MNRNSVFFAKREHSSFCPDKNQRQRIGVIALRMGLLCFLLGSCFLHTGCKEETSVTPPAENKMAPVWKQTKNESPQPLLPAIEFLRENKKQGSNNFRAMREKLMTLPSDLSESDALALMELLRETPSPSIWVEITWAAFVNDSFNVLRSLKTLPSGFVATLDELNREPSNPAVLRDYALQHLCELTGDYFEDFSNRTSLSSDDLARLADCLRRNRKDTTSTLCGTALNESEMIWSKPQVSEEKFRLIFKSGDELSQDCLAVLNTPQSCEHARISSLGVLSRLQSDAAMSHARKWMTAPETTILVKAAAISYLTPYMQEEDKHYLQQLTTHNDKRLSIPATVALKKATKQS